MAGTIVADIIQSDQSYASSINIASPLVVSNTLTLSGGTITPTGNVNIDNGTLFINPTTNKIGVGTTTPTRALHVVNDVMAQYYDMPSGSGYNSFQMGVDSAAAGWYVYDLTNGLYRIKLDGSGRVLKPYQPSFNQAWGGNNYYSTGSGATIKFGLTGGSGSVNSQIKQHNTGGHYSTSTGRFTAPVDGVYNFSLSGYTTTPSADYYILLLVNGATLFYEAGSAGSYQGLTFSVNVQLSANEYVEVYAGPSISMYGTSRFSGYLLG